VGVLPHLPHVTGVSVRLGGICPAARCRGGLVPGRICGRRCRDERLRDLAVLPGLPWYLLGASAVASVRVT
jgi:hypothetical protein